MILHACCVTLCRGEILDLRQLTGQLRSEYSGLVSLLSSCPDSLGASAGVSDKNPGVCTPWHECTTDIGCRSCRVGNASAETDGRWELTYVVQNNDCVWDPAQEGCSNINRLSRRMASPVKWPRRHNCGKQRADALADQCVLARARVDDASR